MITFEQEKLAKEEMVEFLNYALIFLSESADKLLGNDSYTRLTDDQRLTLERSLYLPCLVTAIDSLLNKIIKDCCIDESPLGISQLLRNSINATGQSFCQPVPASPENAPVQKHLPISCGIIS